MFRRFILPLCALALCEPDTGGGTGGGGGTPPPETAKVTLPGGVVVELPKAQAEAYMAAQTRHNTERDDLARKVGAAEAERKAAEEKLAAEARDKEAIKLAKEGEIAKAREIFSAEANARLAKVSNRAKAQEIESTIRKLAPGLDAVAVADMVALVTPKAAFDADTGAVQFLGADGKPATTKDGQPADATAYLTEFLSSRKHFQPAQIPTKTGGDAPPDTGVIGTIKVADVANMTPAQAALMVKGRLRVVE